MAVSLLPTALRWLRRPLVHWMDRRPGLADGSGVPDIGFLADDSRHFEVFAGWLHAQWSMPRGESLTPRREMLRGQMNLDRLPIAPIACWRGSPAGIVSLRADDLRSRPDLSPWLSALYVDAPYRGRGIGRILAHAVVELAGWGTPRSICSPPTDRGSIRNWGGDRCRACPRRRCELHRRMFSSSVRDRNQRARSSGEKRRASSTSMIGTPSRMG